MKRIFVAFVLSLLGSVVMVSMASSSSGRSRIIISTDIGGTDPDDNQSIVHLFMYSDLFDIEGIISSPSAGAGSKAELLRMIDIFEPDYPRLSSSYPGLLSPDSLRSLCTQGYKGVPPYRGYSLAPTEGSEMIIEAARRDDSRPLYVLVWGMLDDVAQALHDAPDIASKLRVYWIGGPNKKWGVDAYHYIASHFPDLWFIENNASYRGFIGSNSRQGEYENGYYDYALKGAGNVGRDFKNYYGGNVKMGDTPSLLYMMDGDPADPSGDSWGGRFEKMTFSPVTVIDHTEDDRVDSVAVYSIADFRFHGPELGQKMVGSPSFTFGIDGQEWTGFYLGDGVYGVRFSPKAPGRLDYVLTADNKALDGRHGTLVVTGEWPGRRTRDSISLGANWWTDCSDPALFEGKWQGAATVRKHRQEVLEDWARRLNVLK